ncbi:MAG: SpoIIIAC/SpoIIIAD family protein [Angelakisella sp.]
MTIIAICVRITTELCSDAGMRAMGVKLELAGAVMGIICALPLIRQALELINGL